MTHRAPEPGSKPAPSGYRAAVYSLKGDFDPDEITRRVGFSPDQFWRKGQRRPVNRYFADGGWLLDAKESESRRIEDHISNLLDRLCPSWSTFQQLGEEYDACISCFIDTTRVETITLPADLVERISALYARMWTEVVLYEEDDQPEETVS